MTLADPTVTIYFDSVFDDPLVFVLNDPVQGELDSAFVLGGDFPVDVTGYVRSYQIQRGRSRELDDIVAGSASVVFNNHTRDFDPTNAAGPFFGSILPTKRITIDVEGTVIFDGRISDWSFDWNVDRQALAVADAVDALGQLARIDFDEWTATASQTAGPRITAALDRSEVNFGANRDIDTGVSMLQGDLVTWGSNVLNYLQLVSRSDLGRLFASREGVLTFRDRHAALNAEPAVTLSDQPGVSAGTFGSGTFGSGAFGPDVANDIPYIAIGTSYGSDFLFNKVGVDREGGTLQTTGDAASQAAYGVHTLSLSGLLLDSDTQSDLMADYLLGIYKEPEFRVSEIQVVMSALDAADRALVLALDLADTVTVLFTPSGVGAQMEQFSIVEGIAHDHAVDGLHVVTLNLGATDNRAFFTLDNAVFGVLDGSSVLAF